MENITILFDILIAILSLWVLTKLLPFSGLLGKSLKTIGYGIVVIGFSQLIETLGLILIKTSPAIIENIHRLILTLGFILIVLGFRKLLVK
jgi:cytochrome b561